MEIDWSLGLQSSYLHVTCKDQPKGGTTELAGVLVCGLLGADLVPYCEVPSGKTLPTVLDWLGRRRWYQRRKWLCQPLCIRCGCENAGDRAPDRSAEPCIGCDVSLGEGGACGEWLLSKAEGRYTWHTVMQY